MFSTPKTVLHVLSAEIIQTLLFTHIPVPSAAQGSDQLDAGDHLGAEQ